MLTCRHPAVSRLPNGSYQCQDCPVILSAWKVVGSKRVGTMYHDEITNEHVMPADFSSDREIRSPCDCDIHSDNEEAATSEDARKSRQSGGMSGENGGATNGTDSPDDYEVVAVSRGRKMSAPDHNADLGKMVAQLDNLSLSVLLPLWYRIGCADHHKDRDCHFWIQEDICTYSGPGFTVEHYGYVCDEWHSPYFGSRDEVVGYLEKKLRAMIREVWYISDREV